VGWFSSAVKDDRPEGRRPPVLHDFIGIHLEGPTGIGHYFRPAVYSSSKQRFGPDQGPILVPDGRSHTWSLTYDPAGSGGRGVMRVTLDDKTAEFILPAGAKQAGATFDRFGILNVRNGGGRVKLFLDDLEFTVAD
jgi:hypothetical protein